ncbi:type III-A CRISPR-associated protein Csm2 [Sediminibacterium sp.]|uniref:type III-A CRISPR-associated protein Csm2 n=1 Tax=Sediminibacterium sp. TaxID=1917865 RepID=UPI0027326716|nr:type III-A CRISPR-associated protein Csm2 [Sediminibacterium sp.]MDP3566387.1 type III-A CRISPR-associated protein Csm2 [Sediminibacterium sp.]
MAYGRGRYNQGNPEEIKKVIERINDVEQLKDITPKEYADEEGYADKIANNSQLDTTQLRKFFGAIREIEKEEKWSDMETDFYLLKPKLAYAAGRDLIKKPFYQFMMACMRKVDVGTEEEKVENFKVMVNFLEAVVAYHKFYSTK